jgi:AcrR family transcriptional regulator
MTAPVNPRPRQGQVSRTEARIVDAASRLFVEHGYAATTLAEVATAAGVGARTVYVRFGSKAELLKRVVDVAIVGDTAEVDVMHRDWMRAALTASTAVERIAAGAAASRQIMHRAGALFGVAQQAAAVEPLVAELWTQGRAQNLRGQREMWARMAADGLLGEAAMPTGADLERLVETVTVVCAAETFLLVTRMFGWGLDEYESWLVETLTTLAGVRSRGSSTPRS